MEGNNHRNKNTPKRYPMKRKWKMKRYKVKYEVGKEKKKGLKDAGENR